MKRMNGFTVVELVVVIIVIAILATLGTVAYSSYLQDAKKAALKSDLQSAAAQLEDERNHLNGYPATADSLKKAESTVFSYIRTAANRYCLAASNTELSGVSFFITPGERPRDGLCEGYPGSN